MPKPSAFRLNGKPLELNQLPGWVAKTIAHASKLGDDDILDMRELAKQIGYSYQTVKGQHIFTDLEPFRARVQIGQQKIVVFGNPKTIKKLIASLESA